MFHTLLLGSIIYVHRFRADLSGPLSGLVRCQPSFGCFLKRLLRVINASALSPSPFSKRFQCLRSEGTITLKGMLAIHMLTAWILQTNSDHLLPVRMVHVCIKDLLTVSQCHSSQASRDVVKWGP